MICGGQAWPGGEGAVRKRLGTIENSSVGAVFVELFEHRHRQYGGRAFAGHEGIVNIFPALGIDNHRLARWVGELFQQGKRAQMGWGRGTYGVPSQLFDIMSAGIVFFD